MADGSRTLLPSLPSPVAASAWSAAAFEEFNNTGAPPFIQGATYEVNATDGTVLAMGWLNGDSNQFTAPEGEDAVVTTTGKSLGTSMTLCALFCSPMTCFREEEC